MSKYYEKHTAKIDALSHDGRGIARIKNKTTFIFGALPGEEIEFRYTKFHRQFDEGTTLTVLKASPDRVKPLCQFFGVCGGCALQHMDHALQLKNKQTVLIDHLRYLGETEAREILPPLQDQIWGYRHRARLSAHFNAKKNKVSVGFREQNSHFVADISRCDVLAPVIGEKLPELSDLLSTLEAKAQIPQVEIAISSKVSALILRHLSPFSPNDLQRIRDFAEKYNFFIYFQPKNAASLHLFYPEEKDFSLEYAIPKHELRLQFQPSHFTQINPALNLKMIDQALELLEPKPHERILDLFCGIGNFTLPLARYSKSVVGVEGDEASVKQAIKNAELNNIKNTAFFKANLFENGEHAAWAQEAYDKILLDPPRAGAKEIIPLLKRFQASSIVYVSCNTATLARDIKLLRELGYTLEKTGMMDMFPHTQHSEAIALLKRK